MASSASSGNSHTAEEDVPIEAPLLDHVQIGAGMSGQARDVTISFWQFAFTTNERMMPAAIEVAKHYMLRIVGLACAAFFAIGILFNWSLDRYFELIG